MSLIKVADHNARATKHALATNKKYPKLVDELDKMHDMHLKLHPNYYYSY